MRTDSVGYILGFCTAVCLICSVFVAASAVGLKERQEANKLLDRQKKVLTVAGLIKEGQKLSAKDVRDLFQKRIKVTVVDLQKGQIDELATKNAAKYDQQKALSDPKASRIAPKNKAGIARLPHHALAYLVSKKEMDEKGQNFELDQYILPIEGKGLWSTLYGYLALAFDFNVIKGLTFYQHGETPGLGGEVDNTIWKAKWPGRLAFGKLGSSPSHWSEPKIEVIKGSAGSVKDDPFRVDGISGATITSKGVSYLVQFWLGTYGFGPFIRNTLKQRTSSSLPDSPAAPRHALLPHPMPSPLAQPSLVAPRHATSPRPMPSPLARSPSILAPTSAPAAQRAQVLPSSLAPPLRSIFKRALQIRPSEGARK